MYAAVQPTELNTLTAELTAQKQMLDAREAALREREINIDFGGGAVDRSTYIISGLLFIVLVLLVLNYTLDYLRLRELQALRAAKQTV